MRYLVLFVLLASSTLNGYSQEATVKSFEELPQDLQARVHEKKDNNGNPCAVIRVTTPVPGISFEGWIVETIDKPGEYVVYVAEGIKKMIIQHRSFIPLTYQFPQKIEGKHTYRLMLELPKEDEKFVRIHTNVKKARLEIANQVYETSDGSFDLSLLPGTYPFTASTSLSGFGDVEGEVVVEDKPYTEQNVTFVSQSEYKLTVNADPKAMISIDGDKQKHGVNVFTLPAGTHVVEATMGEDDRWREVTEVDMSEGNATVDLSMRGNLRITYPTLSEFEITPVNDAIAPAKKTIKTGENISLLGDYVITVNKKGYEKTLANVTIGPRVNLTNFRIEVTSRGDNYFYGINGESQNYEKARKEYEKLAKKGDDIAQCRLAVCYENGYGGAQNQEQALSLWGQASKSGNHEATYELAQRTKDRSRRLATYILAAEQGSVAALRILGDSYLANKNYELAKKYYSGAVEEGNSMAKKDVADNVAAAYAGLGELYYHGWGVTKDVEAARALYAKAAIRDNALALERLADYVYVGYETGKPNPEKAIAMYRELGGSLSDEAKWRVGKYEFDQQHYDAANRFFFRLANSTMELPSEVDDVYLTMADKVYSTDKPAAYYYYSTTAAHGVKNVKQYVRLGYMMLHGQGTSVNQLKSMEYFELAAKMNDPEAICMVGYFYEKGLGITKDLDKASAYYQKSGKMGYMKAYNNLGTVYAQKKDMKNAQFYWELAAKSGNQTAIKNLISYYKKRNDTTKVTYWEKQLK